MNYPDNFSDRAFDRHHSYGDVFSDALQTYEERKAEAQMTLRAMHHMGAVNSAAIPVLSTILTWVGDSFGEVSSAYAWASEIQDGVDRLVDAAGDGEIEGGLHDVFGDVFGKAVIACEDREA